MNRDLVTFGLLGAAHSLNHSLLLVLPPLLQNIAESLNVGFETLGIVATLTFFIYGTGALIGGPLSDAIGSVKVARISIGLAGVASLLFLFSREIYTFALAMFLMALWASFYHPTANKLIAQAFKGSPGNAMGIHNAAGNAGQVLTPTVAFFLGVLIDWRFSFIFFGVLSIVVALFMNRISLEEDSLKVSGKYALLEFFKVPHFWQILLFNALVGFVFRGIEVYFPTYLRLDRGYTGGIAAVGGSLILFFGVFGQLIGGKGSDKYGPTRILFMSVSGTLLSLLMLLLLPDNPLIILGFTFLYGITIFAHQPSMTSLVSRITPRYLMGLSYGVMFFSSFGLGSIAAAVLGRLTDAYGIGLAFSANAVVAVALFLVTILIQKTFNGVDHGSGN